MMNFCSVLGSVHFGRTVAFMFGVWISFNETNQVLPVAVAITIMKSAL